MTLTKIFQKKNIFFIIFSLILFFSVRIFVLIHHPDITIGTTKGKEFSVVKDDYERYANIWWYGLTPYLEHLYEYPPATIPLLIIPLALDQWGLGIYYYNYRLQMFVIEIAIYIFILKALGKIYAKKVWQRYLAILFYNLYPLVAIGFWYEGIDLAFGGALTLALISLILFKRNLLKKTVFWSFFWLSVAIKLITAPLFIPYFFINKDDVKQELKALILGFLIIWGVPLMIFRSSLSVFFFFHAKRALHSSSFPAYLVYTINHFTQTDQMTNLEWFGPLSQKALFYSWIGLAMATLLTIFWGIKKFMANKKIDRFGLMARLGFIYILAFIMASKIFSPPFNIWYVLVLPILPIKSFKKQLSLYLWAIISLVFNTTNIVKLPEVIMIYPFTWQYLRHVFRFVPILAMAYLVLRENSGFKKGKLPQRLT